ncbi:MAG: YbbR-like domain-containing protein [Carboxylicivirga sp.]|jgi:YbbR domain-containing protein|nr:YbbR-like domain-containing protein [Carboxylicivirga sp.]
MNNIKAQLKKYIDLILGKTREVREDGNALIFLVFLFLSACFWVLNALQKDDYTTEVSFPVKFINVSDNEIIKGSTKRELSLKIRGGGFKIFRYHLRQQFSVKTVDLSQLSRTTLHGVEGANLNTREYYKLIQGKLATGLELVSITPDTLFIPLIEKKSKKVPVKIDAKLSFDQQCQLSGPVLLVPDSVVITGPEATLDTMAFVSTRLLEYEKLGDTIVRNVLLNEVEGVDFITKRINITFPVEPFTEANINVPILAINLPDSLQLKTFPPQIDVSYNIGLSKPLYAVDDFNAIIDFSSIDINQLPSRLKVRMNKSPQGINNMLYQPLFVEFLLERKLN